MPTWADAVAALETENALASVRYEKAEIVHPLEAGAYRGNGWPKGQKSNYRWPVDDPRSPLHVHEYEDYYEVHIDRVHPQQSPLGHMRYDMPGAWIVGGAAVGALIGRAVRRSAQGMLWGAGIGLIVGAATLAGE